jgi:hypothetical protein
MDEAGRGGGEEEKTVALCGAGNLAPLGVVVRRGAVSSGLVLYVLPYLSRYGRVCMMCVKHPFSGDTA